MRCTCHLIVCLALVALAFPQSSSYDPVHQQQSRPHEGILDFALKQINSGDKDYGCEIDQARKIAVEETVKNIDSWSVLVALTFLILSFLMLVHQRRDRQRREIVVAGFLAQYHNSWLDARTQSDDLTRRYNSLVDFVNSAEAAHKPQSLETQTKPEAGDDVKQRPAIPDLTKSRIIVGNNGVGRSNGGRKAQAPVRQASGPEVDLIAQINTLQQQLSASHDREKNLQRELSKFQRRSVPDQQTDLNFPSCHTNDP